MYITEKDFENYELILSDSGYPREKIVYEANDKDVMFPSFVRVVDTRPVPGRKISIEVAENGYIVRLGNKSKIATDDWSNRLDKVMQDFLNEEYETDRDLTERESEDADMPNYTLEMNTAYKSKQKRGE